VIIGIWLPSSAWRTATCRWSTLSRPPAPT